MGGNPPVFGEHVRRLDSDSFRHWTLVRPLAFARAEVIGLAQLLPQCEFTKSSYFTFPRPGEEANSSSIAPRQQTPVAVAQNSSGKRSKMRKSPAFHLASAVTGIALS